MEIFFLYRPVWRKQILQFVHNNWKSLNCVSPIKKPLPQIYTYSVYPILTSELLLLIRGIFTDCTISFYNASVVTAVNKWLKNYLVCGTFKTAVLLMVKFTICNLFAQLENRLQCNGTMTIILKPKNAKWPQNIINHLLIQCQTQK